MSQAANPAMEEALEHGTLPAMISGVLERTFLVHSTIDSAAASRMKLRTPQQLYMCGGVVENMLKRGYRGADCTAMCELLFSHRDGPRLDAWSRIWKELRLENNGTAMGWPELEALLIMLEIPRAMAHLEFLQRIGDGNQILHVTQFDRARPGQGKGQRQRPDTPGEHQYHEDRLAGLGQVLGDTP